MDQIRPKPATRKHSHIKYNIKLTIEMSVLLDQRRVSQDTIIGSSSWFQILFGDRKSFAIYIVKLYREIFLKKTSNFFYLRTFDKFATFFR